jgi:hydroxyethylthiazole kinase
MTWDDVQKIRDQAPLVHNITNYVVMNTTANALLALGASPVMAHAEDEVEEMVGLAAALVLNIGTLSASWCASMLKAGKAARRRGIPVVLDPVGAGATALRTTFARELLDEVQPTIVRGNGSEIRALALAERGTKGVDSTWDAEASLGAARALAERHGCVVSVSGAVDLIVSGDALVRVRNGHAMMKRVTGMGCTASAITGAFAAVASSPFEAAVGAMVVNGIAGELAGLRAPGPGSFQVAFLDALHGLDRDDLERRMRVDRA